MKLTNEDLFNLQSLSDRGELELSQLVQRMAAAIPDAEQRSQYDSQIRYQCLEVAARSIIVGKSSASDVVERARAYADFIIGGQLYKNTEEQTR